jgi:hypothetical protein
MIITKIIEAISNLAALGTPEMVLSPPHPTREIKTDIGSLNVRES